MTCHHKKIKSFVLRQGKITHGQIKAIKELMPKYGVNYQNSLLDLNSVFGRSNPKIIEIGFGMGEATCQIAQSNPTNDYIGIEVHSPGVGSLLRKIDQNNLTNLRITQYDAQEVLKHMIPNNSIHGFHIYFPDPWPKKRHHKRRIIQSNLVNLLADKLICSGYVHIATDWQEYALWIMNILSQSSRLVNHNNNDNCILHLQSRPLTKFETRGINLGHKIYDIIFTKTDNL